MQKTNRTVKISKKAADAAVATMPGNIDAMVWLDGGAATITLQADVFDLLVQLGAGNIELGIELVCESEGAAHGNKA